MADRQEKIEGRRPRIRPVTLRIPDPAPAARPAPPKSREPGIRPRAIQDPPMRQTRQLRIPEPVRPQAPKRPPLPRRQIPLIYKSLDQALEGCREKHPLPLELIANQTPSHATWLLSQLKEVRTREELQVLADGLSYRDLSMLFSTLASLKRREETAQIQNLIRLRACHYLYLTGWLTLQHTYPRASVADALADLCMILEDIRFVRDNERRLSRRRISRPLPAPDLGPWRVIWNRVPLISGIALPNSRHFISDIAGEIYDSKLDIHDFYREYALYPDLPLAQAITARYEELVSGISANPLLSHDFFDRFRKAGE